MQKKYQKFNTGFTLLELLIVIAIIGLLASVVIVSFPGAQKRARIAQGHGFADTLRGSLQMDMVGYWPLDEISGAVAKDLWFDQNDGIVCGSQWVEGVTNNALSLDGLNDYVKVPYPISFENFEYRGGNFTISVWINPFSSELTSGYIISKPWNGSGQYNYGIIYGSNRRIYFNLMGATRWSFPPPRTVRS